MTIVQIFSLSSLALAVFIFFIGPKPIRFVIAMMGFMIPVPIVVLLCMLYNGIARFLGSPDRLSVDYHITY